MNYLAHLYFSDPEPLAWAGSLMGDFLKGAIPEQLPATLRAHLQLHRQIDSFTQRSPSFQTSRRRLDPRFRHGRSVLVDVFYDHFLASNWQRYHALPLSVFSAQVYQGLAAHDELLPQPLQQILPRMIEHDWLFSYRQEKVVAKVLLRLQQRLQNKLPLAEGFAELQKWRSELENDFFRFMLEAEQFVALWKADVD